MTFDDRELELIVSDGAYPLKEYKAKALAAELLRLRSLLREMNEQCKPVGTGTGGSGDALNLVAELYEKTKEYGLTAAQPEEESGTHEQES